MKRCKRLAALLLAGTLLVLLAACGGGGGAAITPQMEQAEDAWRSIAGQQLGYTFQGNAALRAQARKTAAEEISVDGSLTAEDGYHYGPLRDYPAPEGEGVAYLILTQAGKPSGLLLGNLEEFVQRAEDPAERQAMGEALEDQMVSAWGDVMLKKITDLEFGSVQKNGKVYFVMLVQVKE